MPGVPSGKGCLACSKQKKKCDQAKPVCSRCRRLEIPCVGSGQQRYKFMEVAKGTPTNSSSPSSHSNRPSLSRSPSNDRTLAVAEFTHKLEVKDLRYDLCWSYGELLNEVPKRLGTNAVLDASASALSSAMAGLSIGRMSQETYTKFGTAVKTLRMSLADPGFVYSPETLLAIFLIWICQSWFGDPNDFIGHGLGISRILSNVQPSATMSEFEQLLLVTIAAPVAFESIYNPKARLNSWLKAMALEKEQAVIDEYGATDVYGPNQIKYIGYLTSVVHLPDLLEYDPTQLRKVQGVYDRVYTTRLALGERLLAATADMNSSATPEASKTRNFAVYQRVYGLYLALEIVLIGIIQVYSPYDTSLTLEISQLCQSIIEISIEGSVWKPLASQWVAVCLASAWVVVTDVKQRAEIEHAWDECMMYGTGQSLSGSHCLFGNSFDRLRMSAWGSITTPPHPVLLNWDSSLE